MIGFVIMHFFPDAVAAVIPAVGLIQGNEPVTASTAILLCVRNEQPIRIIRNLEPMLDGCKAIGRSPQGHERAEGNADAIEGKKSKEAPARKTAAKPQRKSASASGSQQKAAGNMSSGMNQVQTDAFSRQDRTIGISDIKGGLNRSTQHFILSERWSVV